MLQTTAKEVTIAMIHYNKLNKKEAIGRKKCKDILSFLGQQ